MPLSSEDLQELIAKLKDHSITERELVLLKLYVSLPDADDALDKIDFSSMPSVENAASDSKATFHSILTKTRQSRLIVRWKPWTVAAACMLIVGLSYLIFGKTRSNDQQLASETIKRTTELQQPPKQAMTKIINTGKNIMHLVLEDQSVVDLKEGGTLTYEKPFTGDQRAVYLEGEAYFKVTSNRSRPFIVHTYDITTTVLGTSFTIKTLKSTRSVNVILHTGKVVVRHSGEPTTRTLKDTYLIPGQELVYSGNTKTELVSFTSAQDSDGNYKGINITFDQLSLNMVLDKLAASYGTPIRYHAEDLVGKRFSGTVRKKDSLQEVLQNIADLNNLRVIKTNHGYLLNKP